MIANAQQVVSRVREEQVVIVRVGPVPRIRQPEILPHHHAVAIGCVVERLIAGLPDPVANHVEVFVAMIAQGRVVFTRAIAQHRLGKSPVSAARDEPPPVDPDLQHAAVF